MPFFKNKFFVKRNYDCTNIVFCESAGTPKLDTNGAIITDSRWVDCDKTEIADMGCIQLFIQADIKYFGYL